MEIKLFLRTLDQEYPKEIAKDICIFCSWAEGGPPGRQQGLTGVSHRKDHNISCLREVLWLRHEDGFGFVYSIVTNSVFYADQEAIDLIEANLDRPLEDLKQENHQLLEGLKID